MYFYHQQIRIGTIRYVVLCIIFFRIWEWKNQELWKPEMQMVEQHFAAVFSQLQWEPVENMEVFILWKNIMILLICTKDRSPFFFWRL